MIALCGGLAAYLLRRFLHEFTQPAYNFSAETLLRRPVSFPFLAFALSASMMVLSFGLYHVLIYIPLAFPGPIDDTYLKAVIVTSI